MPFYYHIEYNEEHIVDEYNTETLKEAMIANHNERLQELKDSMGILPEALKEPLLVAADALLQEIIESDPQLNFGLYVTDTKHTILEGAVSYWSDSKEKAVRLM